MAGRWRVRIHEDATAFLEAAGPWLLAAEAENNLVLGLTGRLCEPDHGFERPILLGTLEDGAGLIGGCVFRTPPMKLGLTRMPLEAVAAAVDAAASLYSGIPAVLGPEPEAERFASLWAERQGLSARPGMRQRIHVVERVVPSGRLPSGRLREATAADLDTLADWFERFAVETGVSPGDPRRSAERLLRTGDLVVWEDGGPVSMAAISAYTPQGARVGWVYTPPSRRGKGYASACVSDLSQRCLDRGLRHVFLYTDLANPTSNGIYGRIGYRPVLDVCDWVFEPGEARPSSVRRA